MSKSRNAPKAAGSRPSRGAEVAELRRKLQDAVEQRTAASEVLKVISSSPGELDAAFQTLLTNAAHLCHADLGTISLYENGAFRAAAATHNVPTAYAERRQLEPVIRAGPKSPLARVTTTKQMLHIPDCAEDIGYKTQDAPSIVLVELAEVRTLLNVPLLRKGELIGVLGIYRHEVRPFSEEQINLVENFAAQAVIAIENARLLKELRESLEQKTATSEVLHIISSSPGDLAPVFAAMLEKAVRICDANFGVLVLHEGGNTFRVVAMHNAPPEFVELRRREPAFQAGLLSPLSRVVASKHLLQIADLTEDAAYNTGEPSVVRFADMTGVRTLLLVPMLKDAEAIGVAVIYRTEVRPFTDKQIELVKNFAAQAVIAIENARLLKELRERTAEVEKLNQDLEQRVADQVGEIERMGRLRRFLPPQVADLIVASGTEKQLESHRREITALFCDLRGFTGFSESADPEDVMTLLRDYHTAIGEKIIKYTGTLERYAGDGVMVVFNDPVPVEKPALQAVLMALETREAMAALTEKWRELGHDVGFGIGIAHGYATLGTIGFEGRFDYAAIGTVSNVASRLCDEAKPGQILISPRVFTAVKDAVTVEPVGEFTLKGIGRPLAAYNVIAAVSA